jgi:DNA (cytosine-5)-methyltransferase 1
VFIVSDFGGESVDEILAITESLPGYPAPSREAGKGTAGDATKGVGEGIQDVVGTLCNADHKGAGNQYVNDNKVIVEGVDWYNNAVTGDVNHTLKIGGDVPGVIEQKAIPIHDMATRHAGKRGEKSDGKGNGLGVGQEGDPSPTLTKGDHHAVVSWNGDTTPKASEDVSVTLRSQQEMSPTIKTGSGGSSGNPPGIIQEAKAFTASDRSNKAAWEGDISGTINYQMNSESSNLQMGVRENLTVRRLTPIECERLQGFPDNWTSEKMELILEGNEWKATGKVVKQADGPRYKAMGNAVTVNVAEWIGKQIGKVLDK